MFSREIKFIEYDKGIIVNNIKDYIVSGYRGFCFVNPNELSREIEKELSGDIENVSFSELNFDEEINILDTNKVLVVLNEDNINEYLVKLIRLRTARIIVAVAKEAIELKPLFVVSIPKSGTHLLRRLIEAFGYEYGGETTYTPETGKWYSLEYSNTHTSAKDFFIDTVRRSQFGNRDHPFSGSPCLFIYRNPLDILVSEANYYHKEGATAFSGYLKNLSFEQRLDRLIDDPWLLGSIRDRISNFIAYLDFPNVMPVSFEELVGSRGGGDDCIQEDLIWSLQLKLHITGRPEQYSASIYDNNSPTYHSGKIGSYRDSFNESHFKKFNLIEQDFMSSLGYEVSKGASSKLFSSRIKEFIERPLELSKVCFSNKPILVKSNYLQFNLVKFNNIYYAVPQLIGEIELEKISSDKLNVLPNANSYEELKEILLLGLDYPKLIRKWQRKKIIPEFKKDNGNKVTPHPYNILNKIFWIIKTVLK